jgi:hypothetical protein
VKWWYVKYRWVHMSLVNQRQPGESEVVLEVEVEVREVYVGEVEEVYEVGEADEVGGVDVMVVGWLLKLWWVRGVIEK